MTPNPTFGRTAPKRNAAPDTSDVLIDWNGLYERGVRFHRNHARRLWNDGKFPKPIKLGPRKLAWRAAEIDAWIAAKVAEAERARHVEGEAKAGAEKTRDARLTDTQGKRSV